MISIYPNPANKAFSVQGKEIENAKINILDSQGKNINLPYST